MENENKLDKLYKLRSIFEEGFISESEYYSRRAQLVDQLTGTSHILQKNVIALPATDQSITSSSCQKRTRASEASPPDVTSNKKRKTENIPSSKTSMEETCSVCSKTWGKK